MKMLWVIDRFEETYAVLEDAATFETIDVPRHELPPSAKEGDTIIKTPSGSYEVDSAATARRKRKAKGLLEKLKKK